MEECPCHSQVGTIGLLSGSPGVRIRLPYGVLWVPKGSHSSPTRFLLGSPMAAPDCS
jgi:hypothetical protein